jgi:dTDP-4-dehydrorhamnose 3,5-epimerase
LIFTETKLPGAFVIQPERLEDDRGFFARTYCVHELEQAGIDSRVVQRSLSYNRRRGTLRGMHYQAAPHEENKIVTCIRGAIYDVIVDVRPGSPTRGEWFAITLDAESATALFVPGGCAHGFITLADDTTVSYDISNFYHPESSRGYCYDDPAFGIPWPLAPVVIADRDRLFPKYEKYER